MLDNGNKELNMAMENKSITLENMFMLGNSRVTRKMAMAKFITI